MRDIKICKEKHDTERYFRFVAIVYTPGYRVNWSLCVKTGGNFPEREWVQDKMVKSFKRENPAISGDISVLIGSMFEFKSEQDWKDFGAS